jgi:hypothetical protein
MMLELYLSPQYVILVSDQLLIFTIAYGYEMSSFIYYISIMYHQKKFENSFLRHCKFVEFMLK